MLNNRQPNNRRRGRGRGPQGNNGNGNGQRGNESRIDSRSRGNAPQLHEKYKNLAREAQMQGDRVMTEYYLQFSDHYFRIISESRARFEETRRPRDDWQGEDGMEGESGSEEQGMNDGANDTEEQYEQRPARREQREQREPRETREPREAREPREQRETSETREQRPRRENVNRRPQRAARNDDDAGQYEAPATAKPETLSIDMLPPAIGVMADPIPNLDDEPAPTPRRRGRPRKVVEVEAEG